MGRRVFGLICALSIATPTMVLAQNVGPDASRAAYGKGVHAYHAGRIHEAEQFLNEAISAGSRDPRCYYYRGLALLKSGQQYAAEGDFRLAAMLEVQAAGAYDIGQSLARVQGADRLTLEQIRREAKSTAVAAPVGPAADSPFANPANQGEPLAQPSRPRRPGRTVPRVDPRSLPADPTDPFRDDATAQETEVFTPSEERTKVEPEEMQADVDPAESTDDGFGMEADDATNPFPDDPVTGGTAPSGPSSVAGEGASAAVRSLLRVLGGSLPRPSLPANLPLPMPGPAGPATGPNEDVSPFETDGATDAFPAEPMVEAVDGNEAGEAPSDVAPSGDNPSGDGMTPEEAPPGGATDDEFNPFEESTDQ